MKDNFKPGSLSDLIEGIFLVKVGDNDDLELVCLGLVGIPYLLSLLLVPDRGHNAIALCEELLQYMSFGNVSGETLHSKARPSVRTLGLRHTGNEA